MGPPSSGRRPGGGRLNDGGRPPAPRTPRRHHPRPLLVFLATAALLAPQALAQFDDTSNFNFNAPRSTSAGAVRNAIQPTVVAGNIQLVSTGVPPVTWSLQKSADQSSVRVQAGGGQTSTVNYLVRVTASGPTNQNNLPFQVTGNIIINNPNNALSVRFRQVTANIQMFAGPTLGSWANGFTGGPMTFPAICNSFTIPPNGNIICTFNAPVSFAGTGQVTPVATFTDDYIVQAAGGTGNVQGIPVPISMPGGLNSQPCATVSDAFSGARQPTQVTGQQPSSANTCDTKTFSYQAIFGPYKTTECGTFTVTNTATVTPSGGSGGQAQTQSASVNVEVFGCDAAAVPASVPPPPVAPPPGMVPGTTTTTFGDMSAGGQQAFAKPYASLGQVVGQFSGGAGAAAAAQPSGGWTVTTRQNPPTAVSLRANGADTAAVTFTVAAAPAAGGAGASASAAAAPAQAVVTGVVSIINPVGQAFAVQLVAVEVSNSVVMVGSGTASCPAQVLPAATAAGPGTLACTFAVPVSGGTPGVATARVLMPQLAQAVVSPPATFAFAGAAPAGAGGGAGGASSGTARATVDSTFAPAGFAYAPMQIAGSGSRPATATEGGTFLTGAQTWSWSLTLGPFPSGTFCGSNTMSTVARVFPLLPSGQVDPSQQVAQSGTSLNVLVDCGGKAGATATETYTPTGERRRRKLF